MNTGPIAPASPQADEVPPAPPSSRRANPREEASWAETAISEAENDSDGTDQRMIEDVMRQRAAKDILPVQSKPGTPITASPAEPKSVGGLFYAFKGWFRGFTERLAEEK